MGSAHVIQTLLQAQDVCMSRVPREGLRKPMLHNCFVCLLARPLFACLVYAQPGWWMGWLVFWLVGDVFLRFVEASKRASLFITFIVQFAHAGSKRCFRILGVKQFKPAPNCFRFRRLQKASTGSRRLASRLQMASNIASGRRILLQTAS